MPGMRTITRTALTLLLAGTAASVAVAPVAAAGFHGGGGGGFHGGGGFRGGGGFHGGGGFRGGYGYGGYRGFRGYYGGFGFGDALLGAALIGGTAAIIASDDGYYEPYPAPVYPAPVYPAPIYPAPAYAPPEGYVSPPPAAGQQAYAPVDPVEQCTRAAVNEAASRGDTGHVTRIDHVDGHPNGARVTGTLEVSRASRGGAVETAHFTCTADYGQVTAFRFG